MRRTVFTGLIILFACALHAQDTPPGTDILVFDMKEKKGKISLSNQKNITDRNGYDNQPAFFNNDYVMYTSQENGQTDILIYDLYEDQVTNLTNTSTSEYSAYPIPGYNSFASVRVEEDGTQRVWMFQMDRKREPTIVFEKIAPVGYFAWNKNNDVLMFVLGDPITMVLANSNVVDDKIITSNIGRTIKNIPGTLDFAFERTEENGEKIIYRLNKSTDEFGKVITKPENSNDWTITQEGTYITSVGSKLYMFNPTKDSDWKELTDLGSDGSKGITRMAVSQENNRLAIVINR